MPLGAHPLGEFSTGGGHLDRASKIFARLLSKVAQIGRRPCRNGFRRIFGGARFGQQMIRSVQRNKALGMLRGFENTPRVFDANDVILRRVHHEQRASQIANALRLRLAMALLHKITGNAECAASKNDFGLTFLLNPFQRIAEMFKHMMRIERCIQRHHAPRLRDLLGSGEHRSTAQGMSD